MSESAVKRSNLGQYINNGHSVAIPGELFVDTIPEMGTEWPWTRSHLATSVQNFKSDRKQINGVNDFRMINCKESGAQEHINVASLKGAVNRYLSNISGATPDSTFYSHQGCLREFSRWAVGTNMSEIAISDCFVEYTQYLCEIREKSLATVHTSLCTLVNFLSFQIKEDPEILKWQAASVLRRCSSKSLQILASRIVNDSRWNVGTELNSKVNDFLDILRRRQFGTRTHVYTELLFDTKGRPEQIRQINLDDLDNKYSHVIVGVPKTHVVSSVGLLTERVASLSSMTGDALKTYIEYEREKPSTTRKRKPLFTTHNGRASPDTLRRSIKQSSDNMMSEVTDRSRQVVPNEIWQYAMSQILEER